MLAEGVVPDLRSQLKASSVASLHTPQYGVADDSKSHSETEPGAAGG